MRFGKYVVLAGVIGSLTGCAEMYEPKPIVSALEENSLVSGTASLRHAIVRNKKNALTYCAEPQPDATYAQESSGNVDISLVSTGGGTDSGGDEEGSSAEEMLGRSPSVLLARELMYRLCEFGQNHTVSTDQAIDLYKANLSLIQTISSIESNNTTVTVSMSSTRADATTIQDEKTDTDSQSTQDTDAKQSSSTTTKETDTQQSNNSSNTGAKGASGAAVADA
ncbi:MAG: hypothetical protein HOG12_17140, partial [Alphaproteobacteria bacterium]|nr:hypothetical protein [Alphaproteobacteria bacterium]